MAITTMWGALTRSLNCSAEGMHLQFIFAGEAVEVLREMRTVKLTGMPFHQFAATSVEQRTVATAQA